MANINTARQFFADDNQEFSSDDLEALAGGKKGADAIFEENEDFIKRAMNIREQIQQADNVLSEDEQKKYLARLEWIEKNRDTEALSILDQEIKGVIDETIHLVREYFAKLDANRELFGFDEARKVDTLREYKDDFSRQDIEGKKRYMEALPDELKSLQDLRDRLIKLVGNSRIHMQEFSKLRRHEKRDNYLPALEQNMRQFEDLMKKLESSGEYKEEEIETMKIRFKESSLNEQQALLREWNIDKNSESIIDVKTNFMKFSRERQLKYEHEFNEAKTKKSKLEIIQKMRGELKDEYMGKVNQSKYLSPDEKNAAMQSVSNPNFDIEFIELCLKTFDQCEQQVRKLAAVFEAQPEEAKRHYDFWNADYEKKKKIIKLLQEHESLTAEFEKKAKRMIEEGLIARTSVEGENGYIARFRRLSLKEKRANMQNSPLDWPIRKDVLARFKALPQEYQKKMGKAFMEAHLKDRIQMLIDAKHEIDETASIREKFTVKVSKFEKNKLIAPKTAKAYKEWIKRLSLAELKRYYEQSELDDPLRQAVLKLFESLDDKTKRQNAHFYELDLSGRITLLRKLNPENAQNIIEEAESEREAKNKVSDFEKYVKIKLLRESAQQFQEQGNISAEKSIHEQILKIDPNNKISQERLKEIEMAQNPMMLILNGDLKENPAIKRRIEGLEIIEMFENIIRQSEQMEGAVKLKGRSSKLKNEKWKRLHEALFAYTGGEKILDEETGMAIEAEKLNIDTLSAGSDAHLIEHYMQLFREERPDTNNNPKKLRKYTAVKRDGKELTSSELTQEKNRIIKDIASDARTIVKQARKPQKSNLNSRLKHLTAF